MTWGAAVPDNVERWEVGEGRAEVPEAVAYFVEQWWEGREIPPDREEVAFLVETVLDIERERVRGTTPETPKP